MTYQSQTNLVGIDLGTTMSVIAHLDSMGNATTLTNREGEPLTASAVYIDGNSAVVGVSAKQAAAHNPEKVATLIKRSMGQPLYHRLVDGRQFRPETLSAIILKKLKQDAERKIGPISKAVITVPAFFDDTRRKATEDAGRIAGFDVLGLINEPTAAGLSFCLGNKLNTADGMDEFIRQGKSFTALVYDLGGGTFDVTVVKLSAQEFETIATDGEVQLGGKDWDDAIVNYVARLFEEQHGYNPATDPESGEIWRESVAGLAESTKKLLSQLTSAPIECFHRDRVVRGMLSRSQFEQLSRNLLTRTQVVTSFVAKQQAKMEWKDVDQVLLVGGSTRMPMVRSMLEQVTGREVDDSLDPDQIVAQGAAIFAAILGSQASVKELPISDQVKRQLSNVEVIDVNSHSLGVAFTDRKTKKRMNCVLIPKNSKLPTAVSRVFGLVKPGQSSVTIKVLEGEAPEASANIAIGECVVSNLPAGLPAKAPIQIRLEYGTSGRVNVMALDMSSGKLVEADLERKSGLSDEDIEREAKFVAKLKIQ